MSDGRFVRGTTPPLVIKIDPADLLVETIDELELTLRQGSKNIIKKLSDCQVDITENSITYYLKEEDTLSFSSDESIALQCRFKVGEQIVATGEKRLKAERLLSNRRFDE